MTAGAPRVVVCTPLVVERLAVLGALPGLEVRRTGRGLARSRRWAAAAADGDRIVLGLAGGLQAAVEPGDVVVASEVVAPGGRRTACASAEVAAALRRRGRTVHVGPLQSVPRVVDGRARAALRAGGALAVDTESSELAPSSGRFAVVRVVVDTATLPLRRPGTVTRGIRALRTLRRCAPAIVDWAAGGPGAYADGESAVAEEVR